MAGSLGSSSGGVVGRILWVDLASGSLNSRPLDPNLVTRYLGGRGVAARMLWDLVPANLDPESPDNPLIFMTGTLTATPAPASGRMIVACKSPTTGLYVKSSGGGHFGEALKFGGYDGIVIQGKADKPTCLVIREGRASLEEADQLWGSSVGETIEGLRTRLDSPEAQVACIGPAGENGVRYAAVMLSHHNAAARCGVGTVMGQKRLKAIAVTGKGTVSLHDPERFLEASLRSRTVIAEDPVSKSLFVFGTSGGIGPTNEQHRWPTRNFQLDQHEHASEVGGENLRRGGYLSGRVGCSSCTTSCHRYSVTKIDGTSFSGGGPEFETFGSLGAGLDLSDIRYVIAAGILCNELGLDTVSAGLTIQWAIETNERGLLPAPIRGDYRLQWDDGPELLRLLRDIATRKTDLGNLLAEGTARAADQIGGESWKWAIQANGLEQSCPETRISKAYALAFAVNSRGPDHLTAEPMLPEFTTPGALDLLDTLCGPDPSLRRADSTDLREIIVAYHEDLYAALDAVGLCAFTGTCAYTLRADHVAELLTAATGVRLTGEEVLAAGARIINLERAFGVRDGRDRSKDVLPWRILHDPVRSGPNEGMVTSQEELDGMLDRYYAHRGWNSLGIPMQRALEKLDLGDIADELRNLGRLGT
jgi:aldehyde:ferredoxin oxidoreductase